MTKEKIIPLIKGIIKNISLVKKLFPHRLNIPRITNTSRSRFCYAVWLRHLNHYSNACGKLPNSVAEIGPGSTLGTGFAALLSGCKHLYVLDVMERWDSEINLRLFDELIELYTNRATIPDNIEYPDMVPELENYSFPKSILTETILEKSLAKDRIDKIRNEILNIKNTDNEYIKCYVPWSDAKIINNDTIDFIFSHSVLEHVENLDHTYYAMWKWLKPQGVMSHTIDFRSHGITKSWNGHWTFNDFEWKIIKGDKVFLINRQPYSKHIELYSKYDFKILENNPIHAENKFNKKQFSNNLKLSDKDITTSVAYVLSQKK